MYIFATTITGVSFIIIILCGKLYFSHFFCEFVFSSEGVENEQKTDFKYFSSLNNYRHANI